MGVLNIPQLQRSDSGYGGQLLSSLAQLLLSSKLQSGREQEKSKLEATQLEKAAMDAESALPINKGKSPLMDLIQKPRGYDEIPETIQRPVEELPKTSSPNPDWFRIPKTKNAVEKASEISLRSMLGMDKSGRDYTQTKDLMGPDGKIHAYQYNPETKRYDIDAGLSGNEAMKSFREQNQGIWADTGYLDEGGNQIVRNTRTTKTRTVPLPQGAFKKEGLSTKDEESLTGATKSINMINDVKSTIDKVSMGMPKLGQATVSVKRYLSNEDAIKFNAARDNMKNLAQEIIKGIPSNFDVENFIATLPNADYTIAENKERIRQTENILRTGLKSKIENLQKKRMPIPDSIYKAAVNFGVMEDATSSNEPDMIYRGGQYIPNPNKRR